MVKRIWLDSRTVQPGDLFVALRGDRFDGHAFLQEAVARGAVGALLEASHVAEALPATFCCVEVPDVGVAYQTLAANWRRKMRGLRVVAVTGSNGKTSTKDFTASVLRQRFRTRATVGNLNNHVGLPKTVLSTEPEDEAAVWEIGMNHFGEVSPLAAVASPHVAVITSIGMAHIEFLRTRAGIAWEKGQLIGHVQPRGLLVLPAGDDFASSLAARSAARVTTVGIGAGALRAEAIRQDAAGSQFEAISDSGERSKVSLRVPGRHMIVNALLSMGVGLHFGLSLDECAAGLAHAAITGGRLERKRVGRWDILDDSYNANPDSMIAALKALQEASVDGRRFAVLGRMGELGLESARSHFRVGGVAAGMRLSGLCVVGVEAAEIAKGAMEADFEVTTVLNVEDAALWVRDRVGPGDLLLLKGSRSAALDRLLKLLQDERQGTI